MILEKDKVYKIRHEFWGNRHDDWRDYIICSPINDIDTEKLRFCSRFHYPTMERYTPFDCHFVICFDGTVIGEAAQTSFYPQTSFFESCEVLPLDSKDLGDIRKVVTMLGIAYNRKLNKLVLC